MKYKIRNVLGISLVLLLGLALAACGSGGETAGTPSGTLTNDGLVLSIPAEYADLVIADAPQGREDGTLFTVSEKASVEAAEALGEATDDNEGMGWLFSIARISEDDLHELLCGDMSGRAVFAKDDNGSYYLFCTPTDVRMERESAEEMEAGMEQWSALNEWAATVPDAFVAENAGLTAETRGNSDLDIYLSQIAYTEDVDYTISTLEFGTVSPGDVDPMPYVERLLTGVTYEYDDSGEAPDGEYLILAFPESDVRFDFFFGGDQNHIRQVQGDEADGYESYYLAVFDDGSSKAAEIMNEWYHALADANGAGPQAAEAMVGSWAEQIAGRGNIVITGSEDPDRYDVQITWGSSAFETAVWSMTATPSYDGSLLLYEDGRHSILTFSEDGTESEEVIYEDGSGSFTLNDEGQLVWQDNVDGAGDNTVFIRAD